MPNSTAYPEVAGVPITPTSSLLKVQPDIRTAIMCAVTSTTQEFEEPHNPMTVADPLEHSFEEPPDASAKEVVLFWAQNHEDVLRELRWQLKGYVGVLDCSPGDGTFGLIALQDRFKYLCLPLNEKHAEVLQSLWTKWVVNNVLSQEHVPAYDVASMSY